MGGNIGDPAAAFALAAKKLAAGGMTGIRMSRCFRTEPVDCAPGTPVFQNAALTGEWHGSPEALLKLCQTIEQEAGRPANHGFHTSRPLDLDIILLGERRISTPALTVPHPRAKERRFVLDALAEIAGNWTFPDDGISVKTALERLKKL